MAWVGDVRLVEKSLASGIFVRLLPCTNICYTPPADDYQVMLCRRYFSKSFSENVFKSVIHITVFWIGHNALWHEGTHISQEDTAPMFKKGGITSIRNVGSDLPDYQVP
jgi:hypothetical protein